MTSIPRAVDDREEVDVEALTDVTLSSFTGSPSAIGPFDHSTLAWQVEGVGPRVKIRLSGLEVPANGSRIVAPEHSTGYSLAATAGSAYKSLGQVHITVDEITCIEEEVDNLFRLLHDFIYNTINNAAETYWSGAGPDHLWIRPINGEIVSRAIFRYVVSGLPNAWVTIDLRFGLTVEPSRVVAIEPYYAVGEAEMPWSVGGPLLGLFMRDRIKKANTDATAKAVELLQGLVAVINLFVQVQHGKRLRSVEVGMRGDQPFFKYVQCAEPREVHFPRDMGDVLR